VRQFRKAEEVTVPSSIWLALAALSALAGLWMLLRHRLLLGAALMLVGIGLSAAVWIDSSDGGVGGVSSDDVRRDGSFVLRADLKPGNDGEAAARLTRAWIDLDGVSGTHGDAGKHVWVYGNPGAKVTQMDAVLKAMESDAKVTSVVRER
jgi:hypothetical protein